MLTLDRLVENLSPYLLTATVTPHGLDIPISEVVIYDPVDAADIRAGDLVLGIGVSTETVVSGLFTHLATTGAAGLLLKMPPALERLATQLADTAGVSLLSVSPGASWIQLVSLIRSLLSQRGDSGLSLSARSVTAESDLFEIANLVSALVDAPITIEDLRSHVIAYSRRQDEADAQRIETILGRRVPAHIIRKLHREGVFRRISTSPEPVFIGAGEAAIMPRVAIGIHAGGEMLASMWAAVREPLMPDKERLFVDAANLVAIHILRYRLNTDLNQHIRAHLAPLLLEGRPGGSDAAQRLGLGGEGFSVLVAQIKAVNAEDREVLTMRLADLLALHLSTASSGAITTLLGDSVYAVLPAAGKPDFERKRLLQIATSFVERAERTLHCPCRLGIGGCVVGLAAIPQSRAEADQVLRILAMDQAPGPVAHVEDVRMQVLLLRLAELMTDDRELRGGSLGILLNHDAEHGTNYVESLGAYLDAFGDIAAAAEKLHIHVNTLRYRLRKAKRLAGIQLDSAEERTTLMLQIRLLRIVEP